MTDSIVEARVFPRSRYSFCCTSVQRICVRKARGYSRGEARGRSCRPVSISHWPITVFLQNPKPTFAHLAFTVWNITRVHTKLHIWSSHLVLLELNQKIAAKTCTPGNSLKITVVYSLRNYFLLKTPHRRRRTRTVARRRSGRSFRSAGW